MRPRTAPLVVLLLAALSACSSAASDPGQDPRTAAVGISVSDCGGGWRPAAAGPQAVAVTNQDSRSAEVQLVGRSGTGRGTVYAEIEPLGPGTTRTIRVRLGPGRYALRCLIEDQPAINGPVVTVTGRGRTGPGLVPVTDRQLIGPAKRYTAWVAGRIPGLLRDTGRLLADVRSGALTAARRDWLTAHLDYERLGAAYGAFGAVDEQIDGLPFGLPGGVRSRRWHGFHAVEHRLWSRHPDLPAITRRAVQLVRAERRLRAQLARNQVDGTALAVRAHEISENVLQLQLTGIDDFGSHSSLHTAAAALEGTLTVLGVVRHLVATRLTTAPTLVRRTRSVLALVRRAAASGVGPLALPRGLRERLAAAVSGLCEVLAPVAATLEPRRTS